MQTAMRRWARPWPSGIGLVAWVSLLGPPAALWASARAETPVLDTAVLPDVPDLDGDGLRADDPCPAACDCDGDGISDPVEIGVAALSPDVDPADAGACTLPIVDADPTRTSDPRRRDTDGGGLDDGQEDLDRDGALDPLETDPAEVSDDADSDADGWPDAVETDADPDRDGRPAAGDNDSDGDGLLDRDEPRRFALDGGTPTLLAADSDGDLLLDGLDGLSDVDADRVPAMLDLDSDGDGLPDVSEGALDPDADGKPNFLDTNSDGDRVTDAAEAGTDLDCDGVSGPYDADDQSGFCAPPSPGTVDTAPFGAPLVAPTPPEPAPGCANVRRPGAGRWGFALALVALRRRR